MAEIRAQETIDLTSVKSINDLAGDALSDANAAQLSSEIISQVVDVITWAENYGVKEATEDEEVVQGKIYFDSTGAVVSDPSGNPSENGYTELSSVSQSVTGYVSTHMSVDDRGLWLQTDGEAYRICITGAGVEFWSSGGGKIAEYSTAVTLGLENDLHIVLNSGELAFYDGANKVAWVSSSQLSIRDAKIENELRIGNFGFVPREGRLTLKYVGGDE